MNALVAMLSDARSSSTLRISQSAAYGICLTAGRHHDTQLPTNNYHLPVSIIWASYYSQFFIPLLKTAEIVH